MTFRVSEDRFYDVACDGCGYALAPEHDSMVTDDGSWTYLQPDDGLLLVLSGGYGMFVDPIYSSSIEMTGVLCVTCAKNLCDSYPGLAKIAALRLSTNIGHLCELEDGKLIWESLSSCECYRAERERNEAEVEQIRERIRAEQGPHVFAPGADMPQPEVRPCVRCGLLAVDRVHDDRPHEILLSAGTSLKTSTVVSVLHHHAKLEMSSAKRAAELLSSGGTVTVSAASEAGAVFLSETFARLGATAASSAAA
jgi:hypothetical protein